MTHTHTISHSCRALTLTGTPRRIQSPLLFPSPVATPAQEKTGATHAGTLVSQSRLGLVTSHNASPASGRLRPQSLSLISGEGGPAARPHSPCHQSGLAVSRMDAPSSASRPDTDLQGARKPYRVHPGGPCPQSSRKVWPQKVDSGSDTERGPRSLQLGVWTAHRLPLASSISLPAPQLALAKLSLIHYQPRQRTTGKAKVVSGHFRKPRGQGWLIWALAVHTVRR